MQDLREYLRAYWSYVSTVLGWRKGIFVTVVWLAAMFIPLAARTLIELPTWLAIGWMVGCALVGYVFAPYGMWKHHRVEIARIRQK